MMRFFRIILYIFTCIVLIIVLESCSGCAHRQRKRMHRNNIERTAEGAVSEENHLADLMDESPEHRLHEIAESGDYDKMLDCMFEQLNEIKKLKNLYFKGNLSDKDAQNEMDKINKKYQPIVDSIEKASGEGALNYKQHKRQMKLFGEYMKELNSIMNKLEGDLKRSM